MRTLNHTLSKAIKMVEGGEEILVTHRNRVVARILPPMPENKKDEIDWDKLLKRGRARLKAIKLKGPPLSQTIDEDREDPL